MARIKVKQIYSNLYYDTGSATLSISGSLVVSGSVFITSSLLHSASLTISGIDTWGDSGSFYVVDLGDDSY